MSQYGIESFSVRTTLAAYLIVALDTAGSQYTGGAVKLPSGAQDRLIGVTKGTVKDTTNSIDVAVCGIAKVAFNDTVSAGGLVTSDSAGLGVLYADVTAGGFYIGRALQTVSATGTIADVLIQPGWKIIT